MEIFSCGNGQYWCTVEEPARILVFDLDGTLSDPLSGVCRSMNYSLTGFGYPEVTPCEVAPFIGPPLDYSFRQITGEEGKIAELVARYRERYGKVGYAENTLYPGISETIRSLFDRGTKMGVCTSKRADFAEKILELFGLRDCFLFVSGGDVGIHKADQLGGLLSSGTIGRTAVMIGDRAVDILAAKANGLASAGVLWGYGSWTEIVEARPDRILCRPEEIAELIG
jgi:Predicted phosphatases